ncbi:MAG: hypothetical protein HONBIEJF_02632 [Fimbriimonadaceae bacterium]|nr:hypothetical protein [Fimbriimonadaceae bacterium]
MKFNCSVALFLAASVASFAQTNDFIGVEFDSGDFFWVNSSDGAKTLRGNTGLAGIGALETAANGDVYAISGYETNSLQLNKIDPLNGSATMIGNLGLTGLVEGALVITPGGTAYTVNHPASTGYNLCSINLVTGQATVVAFMGNHEINGLMWRNDDMLVGLDRTTNALVQINPATGQVLEITTYNFGLGSVGGMAGNPLGNGGVFATGRAGGSDTLYSFNAYTGQFSVRGPLDSAPVGLGGLARNPVPEPATCLAVGLGLAAFAGRRRKRCANGSACQ